MDIFSEILPVVLIGAAILPLALVGLVGIANYFGWTIVDRVLDVTVRLLVLQWALAGLLNVILGIGIIGACIWTVLHPSRPWHWLLAVALIPFGAWRIRRGGFILRDWYING
jgi:hypothetical protein